MKKTLALLLALLMVTSCMVFTTAAEESTPATPTIIPFATGADLTFQNNLFYETNGYWAQDVADSATKTASYDAEEKAFRVDLTGPFSTAGTLMFKYALSGGKSLDISNMEYLCFDLYISDVTVAAALPMELELRYPGGNDNNEAQYRPSLRGLLGDTLVNGWNHFEIPLSVFGSTLTDAIKTNLGFMRLYNRGANAGYEGETLTMMMRNVYFSDTSLKVAPEQAVGNYYYLKNNNSVGQFTAESATAKMTFYTPEGSEKGLDLRGYEYLEMDVWIGHEALNNVKFTWEMNAGGSYDGRQDTNGDGVYGGEGDEAALYEMQIHETVEQASGTRLVAGEWTTVRIPLSRFKSSNWDYANWRWFRMYSNPFTEASFGTDAYAYRISMPRFVRYEEDSLVYACEDTKGVHGESMGAWDVTAVSSGPANTANTPWFEDIDGDGDKELVLVHIPANDEDPASASGWFYSNGGYYDGTNETEKQLAATYAGPKTGFTAYNGAFNRQNGSVKAIEFDIYIASNGIDADAAGGVAPTAEQATDSILDQYFNFNLGSQGDYVNKITVNKQNPQKLRDMFGSDLRLNDWNHVRLEVDSSQGKLYTNAGLDFDQFAYFRMYTAGKFGYYNGLTIAFDDFRVICDYGEEEPETVTPGGQSEVLTLNTGTGGYGTNGNDKGAPYAGHTNAYSAYAGASVTDATKSEKALYFDYFFPNTVKSNTQAGNGTQWASRNTFNFAKAVDVSAYDTVCFELHWDVDPDASADFLNFLLTPDRGWHFEIRSVAGSDKNELQWSGNLAKFIPGVTAEMLRTPGHITAELTFATASKANFDYTNAVQLGAFVQNTDITVGPNDGAALWIDNVYFKDSTYVAPDVDPEPETVVAPKMLTGATPLLNDTFNLDFRAVPYEGVNADVAPIMDFTFGNKISRVTATKNENGDYIMPFRKILAHCIADEISMRMYAVDENGSMFTETMTYSIKDYCSRMLAREDVAPVVKQLLSDTLRYGAAAQAYAYYNTDAPATSGVTGLLDAPAFDVANVKGLDTILSGEYSGTGAKWRSVTLVLGSSMAIRYAFTADSLDGVSVACSDGKAYTSFETATDGNGAAYYYFDVPVAADQFDTTFTVSFAGNDSYLVNYSVNHYIATKYDASMVKTAALLEAIYNYGVAADAYVAAPVQ